MYGRNDFHVEEKMLIFAFRGSYLHSVDVLVHIQLFARLGEPPLDLHITSSQTNRLHFGWDLLAAKHHFVKLLQVVL